ncbi:MAG: hypothetical protein KA941_11545 [Flavobacteriales bacterium]|nr:hypothetical protein [Flavobacteriales bacterium]
MRSLLLSLAVLCGVAHGVAQCGPCVVGDTCTVDPPFPAVCPSVTPAGTVGVPFSIDVTFWLPPSFPEPTTQLNVVLEEVTLISIENLPLGLTYETNSPTLVFYPQQDPFGCVRVCGTPMVAGQDTIRIHAIAEGTVGGIATTLNQDINLPIQVLPASQDTVADFTMNDTTGCEPVTVNYTPLLSGAGVTSAYDWSFGNGNSYQGADPPAQTYGAGDYEVTLQTTVTGIMLTELSISAINDDWCGDVDEPNLPFVGCVGQPDLYFTVIDAQFASSRSPVINNVQSHTWSGLSIPLGFPPFTLQVYDEDGLSDDDLLGTFTFDASLGTLPISQAGTSGTRNVQVQTVQVFNYSDSVHVFPLPNTALTLNTTTNELCAADLGLVSYAWQLDGVLVPGETGPCVPAANGEWTVTGTSAQGCTGSSTLEVAGVGMNDLGNGRLLDVFPVPNDGRFVVRASGWALGGSFWIHVLDPLGRSVYAERITAPSNELLRTIDLGTVAHGSYRLQVSDGAHVATRPLVVGPH